MLVTTVCNPRHECAECETLEVQTWSAGLRVFNCWGAATELLYVGGGWISGGCFSTFDLSVLFGGLQHPENQPWTMMLKIVMIFCVVVKMPRTCQLRGSAAAVANCFPTCLTWNYSGFRELQGQSINVLDSFNGSEMQISIQIIVLQQVEGPLGAAFLLFEISWFLLLLAVEIAARRAAASLVFTSVWCLLVDHVLLSQNRNKLWQVTFQNIPLVFGYYDTELSFLEGHIYT